MSHAAQTKARLTKLTEEYRNVMDNYTISIQSLSDACQESLQSTLQKSPQSILLDDLIKSQCIAKLILEKECSIVNGLRVNQSTNLVKDFNDGLKGYESRISGREVEGLLDNLDEYRNHKQQCSSIVPDLDGEVEDEDEEADLIMGNSCVHSFIHSYLYSIYIYRYSYSLCLSDCHSLRKCEQVISLICPLTQTTMDTAWKSTKCGHVYSSGN